MQQQQHYEQWYAFNIIQVVELETTNNFDFDFRNMILFSTINMLWEFTIPKFRIIMVT